jgi:hypothetical protein
MKLPADLAARWARQWENPDLRESRLLDEATAWPARLPIGRPTAADVNANWQETAARLRTWRELRQGTVLWETASYRATGAPVEIPVAWEISSPEEWIGAAADRRVRAEHESLRSLLAGTDPLFHGLLVRERSLWRDKAPGEVIQAARLAQLLEPGIAAGIPLRSLSLAGIDSKFYERHRGLILRLLDRRHDGEPTRQGLETFLDAARGNDHWLLLADLGMEPSLPFPRIRVRATDLSSRLEARALLVVENESCLHFLPDDLAGVVAVLGTGNDLSWLGSAKLRDTPVAYWGDLDTWGLTLLARARSHAPNLTPLLMTREIFDLHSPSAVPEPSPASVDPPAGLTRGEAELYRYLLSLDCGRIEQEFLSVERVRVAIRAWGRFHSRTEILG